MRNLLPISHPPFPPTCPTVAPTRRPSERAEEADGRTHNGSKIFDHIQQRHRFWVRNFDCDEGAEWFLQGSEIVFLCLLIHTIVIRYLLPH